MVTCLLDLLDGWVEILFVSQQISTRNASDKVSIVTTIYGRNKEHDTFFTIKVTAQLCWIRHTEILIRLLLKDQLAQEQSVVLLVLTLTEGRVDGLVSILG